MSRNPLYLSQDRHGIFHFRARVPAQLRPHFNNKAEIKRSLKTDSKREAIKLARAYRVELDRQMSKLEKGISGAFQVTLEGAVIATLPNGEKQIVTGTIERDGGEDTTPHKAFLLNQLRDEAKRLEKQAREKALLDAQLAAIQPAPIPQPEQPAQSSPLLSEVIKAYLDEGQTLKRWKPRSFEQVESTLEVLPPIIGDIPISTIDKATARNFKQQYMKLPANMNKKREYRDKSIARAVNSGNSRTTPA